MPVELSDDLVSRILDRVGSGGAASIEDFVDCAVRAALGLRDVASARTNGDSEDSADAETDAFFAVLDENLPPETPVLPDEALTREAVYDTQ